MFDLIRILIIGILFIIWYNDFGVCMNLDNNENSNKKEEEKTNENKQQDLNSSDKVIEVKLGEENPELSDLIFEATKDLPKAEQKKMKKLIKTLGIEKKNKRQKVLAFISNILERFCIYFISNFIFFGLFFNHIKFENTSLVFAFVGFVSFYQAVVRNFIRFDMKIISKNNLAYLVYLILSIYLINVVISIVGVIHFESLVYLSFYFILSEILSIIIYVFIKRHQLFSIFK